MQRHALTSLAARYGYRSDQTFYTLHGDLFAYLCGIITLGTIAATTLNSVESERAVADALERLLNSRPTVILVASTTSPAGPYDNVGRAMERVGCQIERFLAPVEPGTLLLLGYKDDVPILSAPGCFRSAKPNVLDLVLPPMLAKYRLSSWDIASLGQGGLLD